MHHARRQALLLAAPLTLALTIGACGADTSADSDDAGESVDVSPDHGDGSTETAAPNPTGPEGGDAGADPPDSEDEGSPGAEAGAGDGDGDPEADEEVPLPSGCPDEVLEVGDRITGEFEHVEVPPDVEIAILTCDWRDSGNSIASVEVSFSRQLFGTDLAELEGAEPVRVAGIDGYFMDTGEQEVKTNMFQFHTDGVYITGGSIEVGEVDQGDVLELAAAAIEALA